MSHMCVDAGVCAAADMGYLVTVLHGTDCEAAGVHAVGWRDKLGGVKALSRYSE
jgi:hypothetical protein